VVSGLFSSFSFSLEKKKILPTDQEKWHGQIDEQKAHQSTDQTSHSEEKEGDFRETVRQDSSVI